MSGTSLFSYERWEAALPALSARYRAAQPFPHIALEDFVNPDAAHLAVAEFPGPSDTQWIHYTHYNERKMGKTKRQEFPARLGALVDEFNSPRFVSWLSSLIGIPDLLPDHSLEGGGLHQTEAGGFLNVHADFTMHHHQEGWRRRCNVILYLNEAWEDRWGGALELWDADMTRCRAAIEPQFNRAVIFATDETSFHGYPEPITCPPHITRKSLALYFYTREAGRAHAGRATNYRARPGDGMRGVPIWLDKQVVAAYSRVKRRLGLSDDFASRVLGILSRKR